jgi:hypothetical protein
MMGLKRFRVKFYFSRFVNLSFSCLVLLQAYYIVMTLPFYQLQKKMKFSDVSLWRVSLGLREEKLPT